MRLRAAGVTAGLTAGVALLALSGCRSYAEFQLPAHTGQHASFRSSWLVHPEPVLERGAPGEWDAGDVLNPSVTWLNGQYWNFYSGFSAGVWHTGLAWSSDGLAWKKQGRILSPSGSGWEGGYIAANGTAAHDGREWLYWYQAGKTPRIGLAKSSDGLRWRKEPDPVIVTGPRGSWDERGVADPYVVRYQGTWYLYYLGQDRAHRQRLGVARSQDGLNWQKLRSNPVLETGDFQSFDEMGLGEPAVWSSQGAYWMLYTGRDRKENRRLGLARSFNGVQWQRVSAEPVLAGNQPWNAAVVCDPSVEIKNGKARVWFGGGDRPSPDENLHGAIGLAELTIETGP